MYQYVKKNEIYIEIVEWDTTFRTIVRIKSWNFRMTKIMYSSGKRKIETDICFTYNPSWKQIKFCCSVMFVIVSKPIINKRTGRNHIVETHGIIIYHAEMKRPFSWTSKYTYSVVTVRYSVQYMRFYGHCMSHQV